MKRKNVLKDFMIGAFVTSNGAGLIKNPPSENIQALRKNIEEDITNKAEEKRRRKQEKRNATRNN